MVGIRCHWARTERSRTGLIYNMRATVGLSSASGSLFLTVRPTGFAHSRSEPSVAGQHIRRQAATLSEWFAQSAHPHLSLPFPPAFFYYSPLVSVSLCFCLLQAPHSLSRFLFDGSGSFDDGLLAVLVYSVERR
jgi:hypothetical protein